MRIIISFLLLSLSIHSTRVPANASTPPVYLLDEDTGIVVLPPLTDSLFFPDVEMSLVEPPSDHSNDDRVICLVPKLPPLPHYPGGDAALQKFLRKNIRYPADALARKSAGVVNIAFTIEFNGEITHVFSIGPPLDSSLEKEAIRVVKLMPGWQSYTSFEGEGPIKLVIPIKFTLPKKK